MCSMDYNTINHKKPTNGVQYLYTDLSNSLFIDSGFEFELDNVDQGWR